VHEERFLQQLKQIFAEQGHKLLQVNQRPVPVLGREKRDLNNCWLVSDLAGGGVNASSKQIMRVCCF
jgi:hypothetical protein